MQLSIPHAILILATLLTLTTALPAEAGLFHDADFKCPKGRDGYCCKKEGGSTSDPGNCMLPSSPQLLKIPNYLFKRTCIKWKVLSYVMDS